MRLARNVQMLMQEYGRFDGLDSPGVSVIIPARNEAALIAGAIDSVLGQGYNGMLDVLVVDDGSSDETAAKAKGYENRGVRVLQNKGSGVAAARNYGAENATGDVLVWMDADSRMEPGLLDEVAGRVRSGYVGGTARTTPDTGGLGESVIYGASNAIAKVSSMASNVFDVELNPLSEGGFMFCARPAVDAIAARYGSLFPNGTSEDRAFVYSMFEIGPVARLSGSGIVTSSRRTLNNGFIGTIKDKLERIATPVGIPHDGYEAVRMAA